MQHYSDLTDWHAECSKVDAVLHQLCDSIKRNGAAPRVYAAVLAAETLTAPGRQRLTARN